MLLYCSVFTYWINKVCSNAQRFQLSPKPITVTSSDCSVLNLWNKNSLRWSNKVSSACLLRSLSQRIEDATEKAHNWHPLYLGLSGRAVHIVLHFSEIHLGNHSDPVPAWILLGTTASCLQCSILLCQLCWWALSSHVQVLCHAFLWDHS